MCTCSSVRSRSIPSSKFLETKSLQVPSSKFKHPGFSAKLRTYTVATTKPNRQEGAVPTSGLGVVLGLHKPKRKPIHQYSFSHNCNDTQSVVGLLDQQQMAHRTRDYSTGIVMIALTLLSNEHCDLASCIRSAIRSATTSLDAKEREQVSHAIAYSCISMRMLGEQGDTKIVRPT
jgi:hypothetical protein